MNKESKNRNLKNNPKWFYFVLVLFPVFILVLTELILTFANYGNDYSPFVEISEKFKEYKFFNPKLPQKYFGNSPIRPSVIPDGFKKEKNKNTFRIFALGGSTTAGFPHPPNGAFPRLLKNNLQKEYPQIDFEVINLGISAVNTITIRDIIDDVLNENPDLIIIYAGHNEFYGALGTASNVSGYSNLFLTQFVLKLKEYRTVQLVENILNYLISTFSKKQDANGTLMSEMAGEKLVALESDEYNNGIEQFKTNLSYILYECNNKGIPTLVGTLTSNLLQKPLCRLSGCDSLASEFNIVKNNIGLDSKEKLYSIKDKDALRFRAPEKINEIIKNLVHEYKCELFDVQGQFENISKFGIIGDNLMMDHLHPTFRGNWIISNLILKTLKKKNILRSIKTEKQNFSSVVNNFKTYTAMDSSLANLRIKYLKNEFPFASKTQKKPIILSTYEDSLAFGVINKKYSWENAHLLLAKKYLKSGNYYKYTEEMNVLIEDKPFDKFPYLEAIKHLEKLKNSYYLANILVKYYDNFPNFYTAKRLGAIFNLVGKFPDAMYYYLSALKYSQNDAEIFFNLSALYYREKDIPNALKYISKCLDIDPNYPNAKKIYDTLVRISSN